MLRFFFGSTEFKREVDMNTASLEIDMVDLENDLSDRSLFILAVGREIRRQRKSRGMTGKELALRLNVSQQQVSRYECGVCHISVDTLIHILAIFHISIDEFFKPVFMTAFENGDSFIENNHYRIFLSLINCEEEEKIKNYLPFI